MKLYCPNCKEYVDYELWARWAADGLEHYAVCCGCGREIKEKQNKNDAGTDAK